MRKHYFAVVCMAGVLTACAAGGTDDARRAAPATVPEPTGATGDGLRGSGAAAGPHEGERASTPPGTSRSGTPPADGAIVDPTGAATKNPPPPGMR